MLRSRTIRPKGFTIFFAVLVASLSLSIGLAIYNLLVRELALSQTVTQSQYAIYAADAGIECALYWDSKYGGSGSAFATSSSSNNPTPDPTCNTQDILTGSAPLSAAWGVVTTATAATTTFKLSLGTTTNDPCATVVVAKIGNPSITVVKSSGFNNCSTGLIKIERSIQADY